MIGLQAAFEFLPMLLRDIDSFRQISNGIPNILDESDTLINGHGSNICCRDVFHGETPLRATGRSPLSTIIVQLRGGQPALDRLHSTVNDKLFATKWLEAANEGHPITQILFATGLHNIIQRNAVEFD